MQKAPIFDIYRGTTHDGPGLRTTVFFQGCPLRCRWCHNPESLPARQQVWWEARQCIGCLLCRDACPYGALRTMEAGVHIDGAACRRCGSCVAACPAQALSFVYEEWTMDALLREAMRDKGYYDQTGGGVTASGGECLLHADFVATFFQSLQNQGVDTALDTCGAVPWSVLARVLPHTDHLLYDVKLMDTQAHRRYTGQGNEQVLENLRRVAETLRQGKGFDLYIRTPLIPEATASTENLMAIGHFLHQELKGLVAGWELCAFNNSCLSKYEKLRIPWDYAETPLLSATEAEGLRRSAVTGGVPEALVTVTGLLREE